MLLFILVVKEGIDACWLSKSDIQMFEMESREAQVAVMMIIILGSFLDGIWRDADRSSPDDFTSLHRLSPIHGLRASYNAWMRHEQGSGPTDGS